MSSSANKREAREKIGLELRDYYVKLQLAVANEVILPRVRHWTPEDFSKYLEYAALRLTDDVRHFVSLFGFLASDVATSWQESLAAAYPQFPRDDPHFLSTCLLKQAARIGRNLQVTAEYFARFSGDRTIERLSKKDPDVIRHLARSVWPLLFVRPTNGICLTEPPPLSSVKQVLAAFAASAPQGMIPLYLPSICSVDPGHVLQDLECEAFNLTLQCIHHRDELGNFQKLRPGAIDAGVAAFDDRVIADYRQVISDQRARLYDTLLGASSGLQVTVQVGSDDSPPSGLLVLCSPLPCFFHVLAHSEASDTWQGLLRGTPALTVLATKRNLPSERFAGDAIYSRTLAPVLFYDRVCNHKLSDVADAVRSTFVSCGGVDHVVALKAVWRSALSALTPRASVALGRVTSQSPPISVAHCDKIIGRSPPIEKLRRDIFTWAKHKFVFIFGPSGSGKSLVARALHSASGLHGKLDRAPTPSDHESSVTDAFGYVFGIPPNAYTHVKERAAVFSDAKISAVWFDDFDGWPLWSQARFLTLFQEYKCQFYDPGKPLAEERSVLQHLYVSANMQIDTLVEAGRLRPDLAYRFSEAVICLPSLNEHKDDIPDIIEYYRTLDPDDTGIGERERSCAMWIKDPIEAETYHILQNECDWTYGDVRQLLNVLNNARAQAVNAGENDRLTARTLRATLEQKFAKVYARRNSWRQSEPSADAVKLHELPSPIKSKYERCATVLGSNIADEDVTVLVSRVKRALAKGELEFRDLLTTAETSDFCSIHGVILAAGSIRGRYRGTFGVIKGARNRSYFVPQCVESALRNETTSHLGADGKDE